MNESTMDGEDYQLVLSVYANPNGVSVDLGDPDTAGVPGKYAHEQWSCILSGTATAVAETLYGGMDGSHQLAAELLLHVRDEIDLEIARIERNDAVSANA
jgi:hypothetical protein